MSRRGSADRGVSRPCSCSAGEARQASMAVSAVMVLMVFFEPVKQCASDCRGVISATNSRDN